MADFKSLKLTALPTTRTEPALTRRNRLIERLEDQKKLIDEPGLVRTVQRWTRKDGERVLTERKMKVHPWWRTDGNGATVFFVRFGGRPIEFEKGKAGILVATPDQLSSTIDAVISAVRQGELDAHLKGRTPGQRRSKAANQKPTAATRS